MRTLCPFRPFAFFDYPFGFNIREAVISTMPPLALITRAPQKWAQPSLNGIGYFQNYSTEGKKQDVTPSLPVSCIACVF
jgi:hypothetical protein